MGFRFKSDSDKWATINALQIAAVEYGKDAAVHKDNAQLKRAFEDQATTALRLAKEMEDA